MLCVCTQKVYLVEDFYHAPVCGSVEMFVVVVGRRQMKYYVRLVDRLVRALNAHAFESVVGVAEACRVDEAEQHSVDAGLGLDRIACCAGYVGYHGAVVAAETVQQSALAYVGAACYGYGDAVFESIAQSEGVDQRACLPLYFVEYLPQLLAVGEDDILFREVEFEFQQRREMQQTRAQLRQQLGVSSAHLCRGNGEGPLRIGRYRIGYGLGLREVEPASQKRPGGKLAGRSHARSGGNGQPYDFGDYVTRPVSRYLYGIVAGVGVRCEHHGHHYIVYRSAVGVDDTAVVQRMRRGFAQRSAPSKHRIGYTDGIRSAYSYYAERTALGRSRRDDRIVGVAYGRYVPHARSICLLSAVGRYSTGRGF